MSLYICRKHNARCTQVIISLSYVHNFNYNALLYLRTTYYIYSLNHHKQLISTYLRVSLFSELNLEFGLRPIQILISIRSHCVIELLPRYSSLKWLRCVCAILISNIGCKVRSMIIQAGSVGSARRRAGSLRSAASRAHHSRTRLRVKIKSTARALALQPIYNYQ